MFCSSFLAGIIIFTLAKSLRFFFDVDLNKILFDQKKGSLEKRCLPQKKVNKSQKKIEIMRRFVVKVIIVVNLQHLNSVFIIIYQFY